MANRPSSTRKAKKRPAKKRAKKQPAKKRSSRSLAKPALEGAQATGGLGTTKTKKASNKKPAFNAKLDSANNPEWVPPVWEDDILLGAHISIAGGTQQAPPRARAIGATAMQIFTKMANRWADRSCEPAERDVFREALRSTRVRHGATIAHDSYLINLASPDAILRRRSIESFVAELERCEALGIAFLVSHPGNYIDNKPSGIARNADGITEALSRVPGHTVLCMETTAGSGTAIGAEFEDLGGLIGLIPEPHRSRVGVCVDTCHAYSAGYDLVKAYDDVWLRFDDVIGLDRLKVMHLNDSKTPFGSRRDRHELIGEGSIGDVGFRNVMNDPRLARVPKVIETPKGTDPTATDARMLVRLRGYIAY
jgi:deoxyribonuclease-4